MSDLPAHSPLGASSAERWMNCPGSVALINTLGPHDEADDPEWTREGTEAHSCAASCLEQGIDVLDNFEYSLKPDITDAVQTYLDYVRTLPGEPLVEAKVHRPELHPMFYGQLDFAAISRLKIRGVDYKNGAGMAVEVIESKQLRYYMLGLVGYDGEYEDDLPVELTIVQPRIPWHPDGVIRSWETTVGEIRRWAREELLPAMHAALDTHYLDMGEWCRFCPAKLVCPAMDNLARRFEAHKDVPIASMDNDTLGLWYERIDKLKFFTTAIEREVFARLLKGDGPKNTKLVAKRSIRIWKDDAPVKDMFGDAAYDPPALLGPAQIEKLDGGKEFVAEYAFQPRTGETVALVTDKRKEVTPKDAKSTFAEYLSTLDQPS